MSDRSGRVAGRASGRRRAILDLGLGGLCLLGGLSWPRMAEAGTKELTIHNQSRSTVTVTVSGWHVTAKTKALAPNSSWTPGFATDANDALITASAGGTPPPGKRLGFGGQATIVDDKPPARPIRFK